MNNHRTDKRPSSLNHSYRLVWSEESQSFVPAAENKKTKSRSGGLASLVAGLLLACSSAAWAINPDTLPDGATVTHGEATFTRNGNQLTIQQGSQRLITQWDQFNIGRDARVHFDQPNRDSAALNRIQDQNPSQLLGQLSSKGQVFLLNPNGITFGKNAQVNVGGLIASTLELSDEDFLNGRLNFQNNGLSTGEIKNLGHIQANGGVVALIANRVSNQGSIQADNGNIALAAGDQVTLDFNGDGLMTVTVEQGVLDALAENGGLIQADGGFVIMTTQAQNDIYRNVVNNTGIIQAQTLQEDESGRIMLMGGMSQGQVVADGKLDASAPTTGDGGFIETSAGNVQIQPDIEVTTRATNGQTGEWLIDPYDYTVAAEGGDITGETLGNLLADNNITIQTVTGTDDANNLYATETGNGDIFVNDEVTWSSGTTLTLNAYRNIEINSEVDASQNDGGRLVLEYGQGSVDGIINGQQAYYLINAPVSLKESGLETGLNEDTATNFTTKLGSEGTPIHFTTITDNNGAALNTQLQNNNSGNFALSTDIVLTGTNNWDSVTTFDGRFEGLGHSISGLNDGGDNRGQGLFTTLGSNSYIGNLYVENVNLSPDGEDMAGSLAARNDGRVINASSSGVLEGSVDQQMGGLIGINLGGTVLYGSSTVIVTNTSGDTFSATGGLVGGNTGKIINSFSAGDVASSFGFTSRSGGLVGLSSSESIIKNSYAIGDVTGSAANAGGLVGEMSGSAQIKNSYAIGDVEGSTRVGGLVGYLNDANTKIENSFATGEASGSSNNGGLVGVSNGGDVINSFWNSDKNTASDGGTGKTIEALKNPDTFITDLGEDAWDTNIWTFPRVGLGADAEGYELGGAEGLPFLTLVTRVEDRNGAEVLMAN